MPSLSFLKSKFSTLARSPQTTAQEVSALLHDLCREMQAIESKAENAEKVAKNAEREARRH